MKKTVLLLMILTIFSKFLGFFREIAVGYYYGVSDLADIYVIALTIPTVIFSFIGIGIKTTYIPIYSTLIKEEGEESGNRFTNNIVNLLFAISTVVVLFVLLFTTPIVKVFAAGFQGETLALAVIFTRITIFSVYFIGLQSLFEGFLQLKKNFVVPALLGLPLNIILIASIILSAKVDVRLLAIGKVVGVATQILCLIPFLYKNRYRFRFILDIKDESLKKLSILALPVILGTSVEQINKLVDRTIASTVAVGGGVAVLNYANRLNSFIQGIFVVSMATVMYPMISKMAAENDMSGFRKSVKEAIGGINLLVLPATVGFMIFAEPIVSLAYGRGKFDEEAVMITAYVLFFYSIGMVAFGLREVLSRVFYSLHDTRTPMINAAIAMAMNIVLNIVLSRYMGLAGLALATSISATVVTILLFISLRRKIGPFGLKNMSTSFIKMLIASLIMGAVAKLTYGALLDRLSSNVSLVGAIGIGALVYFVAIFFMKIEEVDVIVNGIKGKFKRGTHN